MIKFNILIWASERAIILHTCLDVRTLNWRIYLRFSNAFVVRTFLQLVIRAFESKIVRCKKVFKSFNCHVRQHFTHFQMPCKAFHETMWNRIYLGKLLLLVTTGQVKLSNKAVLCYFYYLVGRWIVQLLLRVVCLNQKLIFCFLFTFLRTQQ